jgi:hypothetical protein
MVTVYKYPVRCRLFSNKTNNLRKRMILKHLRLERE